MSFIVLALLLLGPILVLIGSIWGLVLAFSDHVLWGLAYLLVPFASLAFLIVRWGRKSVRQSFWLSLWGIGMIVLGSLLAALLGKKLPFSYPSGFSEDLSQLLNVAPSETLPEASPEILSEASVKQHSAVLELSGIFSPQNGA